MTRQATFTRTKTGATLSRTKTCASLSRTQDGAALARDEHKATLSRTARNWSTLTLTNPLIPRSFLLTQIGSLLLLQDGGGLIIGVDTA